MHAYFRSLQFAIQAYVAVSLVAIFVGRAANITWLQSVGGILMLLLISVAALAALYLLIGYAIQYFK